MIRCISYQLRISPCPDPIVLRVSPRRHATGIRVFPREDRWPFVPGDDAQQNLRVPKRVKPARAAALRSRGSVIADRRLCQYGRRRNAEQIEQFAHLGSAPLRRPPPALSRIARRELPDRHITVAAKRHASRNARARSAAEDTVATMRWRGLVVPFREPIRARRELPCDQKSCHTGPERCFRDAGRCFKAESFGDRRPIDVKARGAPPSIELRRQSRLAPVREHPRDVLRQRPPERQVGRHLRLVEPAMAAGFQARARLAALQRANEEQPHDRVRRGRMRLAGAVPHGRQLQRAARGSRIPRTPRGSRIAPGSD